MADRERDSQEPEPGPTSPPRAWQPGDRRIAEPRREDGELRCGYCGTPLAEDQTYCLGCGSPTPRAPRIRSARGAAAMIAAGLVVLGGGSGVLAYFVARDGEDSAGGTTTTALTIPPAADAGDPSTDGGTVPTDTESEPGDPGELPTDTTATDTVTVPESEDPFPTVTGPEAEPPEEPPEDDVPAVSDWPPGRTAWTAFLSSVRDEADARAAASRLEDAGTPAGVLDSSDHPNLEPGFWVVFSGVFDSRAPAASRASSLSGEFPTAYARRVES